MNSSREPLAVTTRPDTDLYISIFEEWLRVFPKANGTGLDLCIKPYSASAVKLSTAHGGDGNIFNLSPVSQTWWSVLAQWKSPADTNNLHNIVVNLVDYMTAKAQASGNYLPFKFPNDASSVQNVVASWGPESVAKMRAASEKYDRAQVFQKLQAGGWLVSKA
ncbi:hypothetical protein MMC16_003634 [Acarospora aff. strigata]|nr:hypothetical protein [Acarospora aff. strigata]